MKIPENVKTALDLLDNAGFEAYLVGGCVRDFVRGKAPSDYDITTPSTPDETKAVFRDFPVFLQGEKHGTVGVIINGEKLEITTHRRDGDYIDHRRPESVSFSRAVADDLSRRDFTVNALAYSPKSGLVDLFGGADDIKNRVIRCVGNPDRRFDEDALRILRALRFSSTLGFEIDEKTKESIFKNAHLLKTVSAERIRDELIKFIGGDSATSVFREFYDVFEPIIIGIDTDLFGENLNKYTGDKRFAFFLCVSDSANIEKLKLSGEEASFYRNMRILFYAPAFTSRYELKKAVAKRGEKAVRYALEFRERCEMLKWLDEIIQNGECTNKKDLKINGRDLISLGIEQGTEIGQVLDEIFDLVLQDKLQNERESLIEFVKNNKQ